jgi:hypothetical protein
MDFQWQIASQPANFPVGRIEQKCAMKTSDEGAQEDNRGRYLARPYREGPRPQHFHLIWPVSGLTIQGASRMTCIIDVLPSHAEAQWC